jgi:hypothetical protein
MAFQVTDSAGQGSYDRKFISRGFLHTISIVFIESADKGWEAAFMVFAVKPGFMSSPVRSLLRKIKEVNVRASLDAYAANDFPVSSARLILQ